MGMQDYMKDVRVNTVYTVVLFMLVAYSLFSSAGSNMACFTWFYNGFWRHVCQDMEGLRHLYKCKTSEEG